MRSFFHLGLVQALVVGGTACSASPGGQHSPPASISPAIDGDPVDWIDVPALITDPADAPAAELDLLEIRARDDGRNFDLLLVLARPVSLQGLSGSLRILFDADGDTATGETREGLPGVDLVLAFSQLDNEGKRRGGSAVLFPGGMSPYALDLHLAPVYQARNLELGFSRRRYFRNIVAFKLVFADHENVVRDETAVARFALADVEDEPTASRQVPASPEGSFRVLSWNVSDHSIRENPAPFIRVIRAIDPDILLLDEVSDASSSDEIASWFGGGNWQVALGTSGGYQRGVVAARSTVTPIPRFATVQYPGESVEEFERMAGDSATRTRIRRSLDDGVGTSAATTMAGGSRILLVTVDLWCCGSPGSYEEKRRVAEAIRISELVREGSREAGVRGVIVAGDLNLVATSTPLDLLRQGGDVDGTDLEIVEAMQLDGRNSATWYGPAGSYLPSRLDFSLFSGSALDAVQAFVFDPRDLAPVWLRRYNIDPVAVLRATDHLPVVVDFRWKESPR